MLCYYRYCVAKYGVAFSNNNNAEYYVFLVYFCISLLVSVLCAFRDVWNTSVCLKLNSLDFHLTVLFQMPWH